jgi:hypothetical protein
VLVELGLATYEQRRCTLLEPRRADLERSDTYTRCREQLAETRRRLAAVVPAAA